MMIVLLRELGMTNPLLKIIQAKDTGRWRRTGERVIMIFLN